MKKILLLLLLATAHVMMAQDIKITKFERNYTSLIASMNPVYDNTGEACAVIKFFTRDEGITIEPNLGVLKRQNLQGEIRLWVPKGTKRITVRRRGLLPLTGYEIPLAIEPKVTYEATISIVEKAEASKFDFYVGAGFNVMSISGPSLTLGFDIQQHHIELGGVYGLNKSDDLYFYQGNSDPIAGYHYQPLRIQLSYGYELPLTDMFSVMPQVGLGFNIYTGEEVIKSGSTYGTASSLSALGGVRLMASITKQLKVHVTPEYDFGLTKNDACKLLSHYDDKCKSWTEGFNLNIGLLWSF